MITRNVFRAFALATLLVSTPIALEAQDGWNLPVDPNRMIRAGETKNSSLDSGDRALSDGSYFEAWFFEGRAGQRVTITMRSGSFDTYLAVGRHDGDVIETNDDFESGTSTDSRVSISLPADGMYMIRANSLESSQTGDYTLALDDGSGAATSSGGTVGVAEVFGAPVDPERMLRSAQQVSGELDAGDRQLPDDSFFEVHYIQLEAGQTVTVTMRSGAFDTYLSIGAQGASEAAETNDDFEEGSTDSRVELTAASAGTYVIIANSLGAGMTGAYTLVATVSGGENVGGATGDLMGGMGKASTSPASRVTRAN